MWGAGPYIAPLGSVWSGMTLMVLVLGVILVLLEVALAQWGAYKVWGEYLIFFLRARLSSPGDCGAM